MLEPPLLEAPPPKQNRLLYFVTAGAGLLQLALSIASVQAPHRPELEFPVKLGIVLGGAVVWPLIVAGIFSIGRRFRSTRNRAIIVTAVWGMFVLSHIGTLATSVHHEKDLAETRSDGDDQEESSEMTSSETGDAHADGLVADKAATVSSEEPLKTFDFSPGSNDRLVKLIEQSQESTYHDVVVAYAAACRRNPEDATLALERVRFIQRFSDSEDQVIESAGADYIAAKKELLERFPEKPGTVLFVLEQSYGAEFEKKAEKYHSLIGVWSNRDAAQFLLLRAQRTPETDAEKRARFSLDSFRRHPTAEAGIIIAETASVSGGKEHAIEVLKSEVFETAGIWLKKQRMDLWFDLGQTARAVAAFKEIRKTHAGFVTNAETADKLAKAGSIGLAREVLAGIKSNTWSRTKHARDRLQFELNYGDPEQAEIAYRALRKIGYSTDPFFRSRASLLWKFPGASWTMTDMAGLLMLAVLLASVAMSPLLILLPVHYWSLLRQRNGRITEWTFSSWGLRTAWLALGSICAGMTFAIWLLTPELLMKEFSSTRMDRVGPLSGEELMKNQFCLWAITGVLSGVLLWREKGWRLLGPGQWSVGKAIGMGLAVGWGLRMLLGTYLKIVPMESLAAAKMSPMTTLLMTTILDHFGPVGLVATAAIFVPIVEEVLFRGVLLGAFARHIPFWAANLLQSIGFALVHEELKLAPFFVGFAFLNGVLVRKSNGLLPAIVLHAFNNLLVCGMLIFLKQRGLL